MSSGKILAHAYARSGGGMAANASVAIARLGGRAEYWGRVGGDPLGRKIIAELRREGVTARNVRRVLECVSPNAAILIDERGDCLVCAFNDPALDPDPSWLPLDSVSWFDVVLADVRWPAAAERVFDAALAARVPRIFDGDVGPPEHLSLLARKSDFALFSERGLALLVGLTNRRRLYVLRRIVPPQWWASPLARVAFYGCTRAYPATRLRQRLPRSTPWPQAMCFMVRSRWRSGKE